MRIITIEKGTPYFQLETDMAAVLSAKSGDLFLNKENCLKYDTEVHLIRKRGLK